MEFTRRGSLFEPHEHSFYGGRSSINLDGSHRERNDSKNQKTCTLVEKDSIIDAMKRIITILAIALSTVCGLADQERDAKIQKVYAMGVKYMKAGDYANAEKYLNAVVRADPKHGHARSALDQLKSARKKASASTLQRALQKVTLEQIELEELSVSEAIEALKAHVDNRNGEQPAPNFIIKDPGGKLSGKTVSLNLQNIPAETALNYILSLAGAQPKYTQYMVEIHPL